MKKTYENWLKFIKENEAFKDLQINYEYPIELSALTEVLYDEKEILEKFIDDEVFIGTGNSTEDANKNSINKEKAVNKFKECFNIK